mmetsp:Transcript_28549/g.60511  ORF Transcript_28549/g.60511 Transcript_28549/m.60511 type:complete len:108 (-) Transcript_28549:114-437(-)
MTQERKRRPKEKLQQEKENKSVKYNTRSESQDEREAMTEEAINMAVEAAAYATVAATAANEYLQEDTLTHPPSIEPASIEELIDQRVHEHHDQVEDQQQQVPDTVEI